MNRKCQSTVEFIVIFILILVLLSVGLLISAQKNQDLGKEIVSLEVRKVVNTISDKINTAVLEGDGFSVNLELPERILNFDYSMQIQSNTIIIAHENTSYLGSILTDNITGTLSKGINIIKNINGNITIT